MLCLLEERENMQPDDSPDIPELIGSALSSGDLAPRKGACGLDKVMALGLVGMRAKMADAVFRLKYANNGSAYSEALQTVTKLAQRLDRAENWRMQAQHQDMAKAVLDYWLDDKCEVCGARSENPDRMGGTARKITGDQVLEGEACKACNGSGKRPFPWLNPNPRDRAARYQTALLVAVEETERKLAGSLIAKLFASIKGKT
ncbi:MAG: hypothetical protein M0Z99_33865 [Betaproteobacteria bacterium]|nr:hypothetical protein [Betaproteobacteria bacterium]